MDQRFSDSTKVEQQPEGTERRPYETPRVLYREPLEAFATVCSLSKASPAIMSCSTGPVQS